MGKMMNFGRYTPETTDPQGRRIADPNVYGKTFGTGQDQVTVSSWPEVRKAWQKKPVNEREIYEGAVGRYMTGETDILDDVNIEEPTVYSGKNPNFTYTLKKGSPNYIDKVQQYGHGANRARTDLFLQSGMSQQDWAKQPAGVRYSANPLDANPLDEDKQYNFQTAARGENYNVAPAQVANIRYVKPPAKPVAPVKTTAKNNVEYTEELTKAAPAPVKPTYTKEELTSKNLPLLKAGKIATQKGSIKRIVDPNEPEYKGAGMDAFLDTSPKAQRVQQETGYNTEKRRADAVRSSETGQRMEFTGGAVNKKDLKYQAKYNKQYDKFQAEKDKNPMNNKTLELFYGKNFQ